MGVEKNNHLHLKFRFGHSILQSWWIPGHCLTLVSGSKEKNHEPSHVRTLSNSLGSLLMFFQVSEQIFHPWVVAQPKHLPFFRELATRLDKNEGCGPTEQAVVVQLAGMWKGDVRQLGNMVFDLEARTVSLTANQSRYFLTTPPTNHLLFSQDLPEVELKVRFFRAKAMSISIRRARSPTSNRLGKEGRFEERTYWVLLLSPEQHVKGWWGSRSYICK